MRRTKLFVLSTFVLLAITIHAVNWTTPRVTGQGGGGTLSAPTGVNASDGDYANKVGIYWNTVRGATTYRVFRNVTNDTSTAMDVGTSAANYFFDASATAGQQYFYWVRAESKGVFSDMSTANSGIRAVAGTPPIFYTPLEPPPAPAGNPITAAKASLGKALFWDEQLSSTKTVACGTCHRPGKGGSDPRSVIGSELARNPGPNGVPDVPGAPLATLDDIFGSPGVPKNYSDGTYGDATYYGFGLQVTGRKSPTYLNAGYATGGLFWDGRALDEFRDPLTNQVVLAQGASLESQVLGPPLSDVEMAHGGRDWTQVALRMQNSKPLALASNIPASLQEWIGGRTYPQLFEEAFGTPEVTPVRIAMAIATHERQLFSDRTPLDQYASGIPGALTAMEQAGATLFFGFNCTQCHDGPLMSDHLFHNIGVRPQAEDLGRGGVTNNPDNNGQFKTPVLRNVELHEPFMHNGKFQTLEEVVNFYNRGGDFDAPNIDRGVIRPMGMTMMERQQLVAFMKRPLTDLRVRDELPPFDRPQLYTESNRVPQITGTGRAGTGAVVPVAIAIEPPLAGNSSFTVAMDKGVPSASAVLVISSTDPGLGTTIPSAGTFTRSTVTLNALGRGSVNLSIPNNPALIGQTFFGRWYVPDAGAANGFSVSRLISFTVFGEASVPAGAAFVDFDGDRKTDISVFRAAGGEWWYSRSSDSQYRAFAFGTGTDKIVPADYTGDGKTDVAIFRPSSGEWFIMRSEDMTFYSYPFGASGDIPAPGDYDGDGQADTAVFRPSNATWYIRASSGPVQIYGFGADGDVPQIADYDGDGKSDIAVYRPNGANGAEWWISKSTGGVTALQFGAATDKPVAADFTGDGKADVAFWRPDSGYWYVLRSEDFSYFAFPFGTASDIPAPGDYDGDGKTDAAVFRPAQATWYINRTTGGLLVAGFGANGDTPVPSAYIP